MSTSLKFLLSLCILLVLAYVYFTLQAPTSSKSSNSLTPLTASLHPDIYELITIQLDPEQPVSEKTLMKGYNGFLVYKNPDDPKTVYLFNELKSLQDLDINHDNRISGTDPAYQHIYYAHYKVNEGYFKYVPLLKVGIRAILFNLEYLEKEGVNDPARFSMPAGTVILSDGSRRNLMVLPVPYGNLSTKRFVFSQ
ncbi:MAG: hypothetical protein JSS53_06450 [Proteobacteria bacterium]|nr:hypothetical protein [Pseudomonadota bacterium]